MSRDNSAQRMTAGPHEQAILLDGVTGRPAVKHKGWPNGQKTVDAETLSGNCCCREQLRLDNNTVERALKLFIRQRKNSLFYATEHSAYIASVLTSLIATCVHAGVNALE